MAEENKVYCYKCGGLLEEGNRYRGSDNNLYCECCFDEEFFICDDCGEVYTQDRRFYFDESSLFCADCYSENVGSCDVCGENYHQDDMSFCDDCDTFYCCNCNCNCNCNNNQDCLNEYVIPFKIEKSKTFKKNPFKNFCGVEIETINNNLEYKQFNKDELEKYQFSQVEDGSVQNGCEFVSNVFNGDLLFNNITKFCEELNKRDFKINSSCGLHIHIKVSKRVEYLKKLILFYMKYENLIFDMLPDSRQENHYCNRFNFNYTNFSRENIFNLKNTTELKQLLYFTKNYSIIKRITKNKYDSKRYNWINLHSVFYRGTLEIRNHSGTINPIKINNWLKIHLTILNLLENVNIKMILKMPNTKEFFLSLFDDDLSSYIQERINKFNHIGERFRQRTEYLVNELENQINNRNLNLRIANYEGVLV